MPELHPQRGTSGDETIHAGLLDALLRRREFALPNDLASRVGLSEAGLRHELGRLAAAGCEVESSPGRGVRLAGSGIGAWSDYLRWRCPLPAGGRRIIEVYRSTGSTQDAVRRQVESMGWRADGGVAVAEEQTSGRGRLGRRWVAPAGSGITFSMAVVTPGVGGVLPAAPSVDRLMLATAVAVAKALEAITPSVPWEIKWPNDIVAHGEKIAGILVETFRTPDVAAAVIGVGVNTALTADQLPADLRSNSRGVTSLAMLGVPVDRLLALGECVASMDATLAVTDPAPLLEQWRRRSVLLARRVHLRHDGKDVVGDVVDLDPLEGLIVRTRDGALVHLPSGSTTVDAW